MDIQGVGLFRMISQQLRWLGQRQEVLSQNLANSDTPGYQARDIEPVAFGDALRQAAMVRPAVTQAGHLQGRPSDPAAAKTKAIVPWEISPDGNGVVLEQQMTALAETQADYQMATELYRKQIAMLKTAIGANKS
jgi:flagellar basal-body rod protein FlgB